MRAVAVILATVSSALAYSVISPNAAQGWTNQGPQPLTWQRVDTDRLNFTAVLTNQQVNGFNSQVLAALVDGTLGKINLNPPSGGWPTGSGFRVDLVQDALDLNTILAQSPTFNITQSTSTIAQTTGTGSGVIVTTPTPTDTGASSTNTDPIVPPTKNGASSLSLNAGLLGAFSLLGFALA